MVSRSQPNTKFASRLLSSCPVLADGFLGFGLLVGLSSLDRSLAATAGSVKPASEPEAADGGGRAV